MNWESLRTKYDKIMETVHENYPKTGDIAECPYRECIKELHNARITSKVKKIRSNYKKAIDLGKRSGGGKIIMTFYDYARTYGQDPQQLQVYPLDLIHQWFQRIAL